jgi:hypothetical protein
MRSMFWWYGIWKKLLIGVAVFKLVSGDAAGPMRKQSPLIVEIQGKAQNIHKC